MLCVDIFFFFSLDRNYKVLIRFLVDASLETYLISILSHVGFDGGDRRVVFIVAHHSTLSAVVG